MYKTISDTAKFWLILFILAFAPSPASMADEAMDAYEFTQAYVDTAKTVMRDVKFTIVKPLELRIDMDSADGPRKITVYLDNAFTQYMQNPANMSEVLRRHIGAISSSLSSAAIFCWSQEARNLRGCPLLLPSQRTKSTRCPMQSLNN